MSGFPCYRCGKLYKSNKTLEKHLKDVPFCVGVIYVCKRCLQPFDNLTKLKRHQHNKKNCLKFVKDELETERFQDLVNTLYEIKDKSDELQEKFVFFNESFSKLDKTDRETVDKACLNWLSILTDEMWKMFLLWAMENKEKVTVFSSLNRVTHISTIRIMII